MADFAVVAAFGGIGNSDLLGVGRMVGALVFGFALVFIYYSKSELLTSNMMIVSIGAYHRRTTPKSWNGRVVGIVTLEGQVSVDWFDYEGSDD